MAIDPLNHARAKSLSLDFGQNSLLSSVFEIVWQIPNTIQKTCQELRKIPPLYVKP